MGYYQDKDEDAFADLDAARFMRELDRENVSVRKYHDAKAASVGARVPCPACGGNFLKRSYQQAFCRNRGPRNCKDLYWNAVNPRGLAAGRS